jgi:hypothetical protein
MLPNTADAADALRSVRREKLIWFSPLRVFVLEMTRCREPSAMYSRAYCSVRKRRQHRLWRIRIARAKRMPTQPSGWLGLTEDPRKYMI